MRYELPPDRRTGRRRAVVQWSTFLLAALLVATLAYLGYVGFEGSRQAVEPGRSRDCRTPAIAFGWEFEAVNYDAASDEALVDQPDPTSCDVEPVLADGELRTPDGIGLAAWYVPAANGSGPGGPTIVLAHGHGVNKSGMLSRAEVLHRDYNLLLLDFRNHGQSAAATTTVGLAERTDLRTVIDWLEATMGPERIGVLGVSMGAAAAINEARSDERVDALVLESTHATLANALQARLELSGYPLSLPGAWAILLGGLVRTGQDMSAADPLQAIEDYGPRPLLLINGGRDDTIGRTDADDLLAAALAGGADARLQVCEEAGHAQSLSACPDEYRDWVLGFFSDALGG